MSSSMAAPVSSAQVSTSRIPLISATNNCLSHEFYQNHNECELTIAKQQVNKTKTSAKAHIMTAELQSQVAQQARFYASATPTSTATTTLNATKQLQQQQQQQRRCATTANNQQQASAIKDQRTLAANYQLQYQEEFNKMRERLFRMLSKVPIQVETVSQSAPLASPVSLSSSCSSASSTGSSSASARRFTCESAREPLLIKYYNDRSLAEILEHHFKCSLIKHNYELGLREPPASEQADDQNACFSGYQQLQQQQQQQLAAQPEYNTMEANLDYSGNFTPFDCAGANWQQQLAAPVVVALQNQAAFAWHNSSGQQQSQHQHNGSALQLHDYNNRNHQNLQLAPKPTAANTHAKQQQQQQQQQRHSPLEPKDKFAFQSARHQTNGTSNKREKTSFGSLSRQMALTCAKQSQERHEQAAQQHQQQSVCLSRPPSNNSLAGNQTSNAAYQPLDQFKLQQQANSPSGLKPIALKQQLYSQPANCLVAAHQYICPSSNEFAGFHQQHQQQQQQQQFVAAGQQYATNDESAHLYGDYAQQNQAGEQEAGAMLQLTAQPPFSLAPLECQGMAEEPLRYHSEPPAFNYHAHPQQTQDYLQMQLPNVGDWQQQQQQQLCAQQEPSAAIHLDHHQMIEPQNGALLAQTATSASATSESSLGTSYVLHHDAFYAAHNSASSVQLGAERTAAPPQQQQQQQQRNYQQQVYQPPVTSLDQLLVGGEQRLALSRAPG